MKNRVLVMSAALMTLPQGCPPDLPQPSDDGGEAQLADRRPTTGILFGSYGDVDGEDEIRELVTNTMTDRDVVPLPGWLGSLVANLGWQWVKDDVKAEYEALGWSTGMRDTSRAQAVAVAAAMGELGEPTKAYVGFTMTFPFVAEALDQARADGIERLVVMYQGAQYSHVTAYIVFRHVREYLAAHPDWDVEVIGVRSYSDDPRFRELLTQSIADDLAVSFPDATAEQVCIFLPMHGNVLYWIDRGDPYLDQVIQVVSSVEEAFADSFVSYGFQNHDEVPFTAWTEPNTDTALDVVAEQPCPYVLIDGRISFTVDSLETLMDHAIAEPEYLLERTDALGKEKIVSVSPMWNSKAEFVDLLAEIAVEALDGGGDIERLTTD